MQWKQWLEEWNLDSLKFNVYFMQMEFSPSDADKDAAWDLYVEMLTRVTTQELESDSGDEGSALASIYQLFGLTRGIIREHGRGCSEFTKLAIVILNQKVRPFTAKWHGVKIVDGFKVDENCVKFRQELLDLQVTLRDYTRALAAMAGVEDWTELESV